jgi:hypothetical protein
VAGILTSLLIIKPQYLLFAPFSLFAAKSKKSYSAGFIVGVLVFILLNLVIVKNLQVFFDYPKFVLLTENPDFGSRPYQLFTFFGLIKQIFPSINSATAILSNLLVYIVVLYFIFKGKIERKPGDIITIGILTTTLFSVHALAHDLMVFLLPIYVFSLARTDKYFIYSGLIFIAAGIFTLAPTSIITIVLTTAILFLRLYSLRSTRSQ